MAGLISILIRGLARFEREREWEVRASQFVALFHACWASLADYSSFGECEDDMFLLKILAKLCLVTDEGRAEENRISMGTIQTQM